MTVAKFKLPLLLFNLIGIANAWDVQSLQDESRQCAKIFFQPGFKGPSFPLNADERSSDLSDVQYYMRKQVEKLQIALEPAEAEEDDANPEGQSTQHGISFQVREGCSLTLASEAFLKGQVHEFSGDVENMPEEQLVPLSAACECPKECTCETNKLRHSECGRAYLQDDCSNCKAQFTSLKPGANWNNFPERWASDVKSIILRDGCDVAIRSSSGMHRHSSRTAKIIQDAPEYGSIAKYKCTCSAMPSSSGSEDEGNNKNYPPLVNIPRSKGGINNQLFKDALKNHPGLISALQSIRKKRASKNAYILLLGMTGSGKSSAVNLLFDHPNITKTGDFVSTTSDILQFSVPVPVRELGMNNTALHVIDTPGIGDTGGLAEDSRFLASLDNFLSTHEDLKHNLPNVVLIFSKFSDNRFRGEGSSFVKMLRTIDLFKDKIIDKKSTNVIFVLTHYMSETKEVTRDPGQRINSIREVIQEFSSLPRPIHIVLAENKPDEVHLPSINGFYRLPNGDFYPKNLFDQMQRNLVDNEDPVGEAIIRTAFSNSDSFQITGKRYPLLHKSNSKVTKYLGMLGSFTKLVVETDVSTELQKSYNRLDSQLKRNYPQILQILQRSLFVRNILQKSDLPQTSSGILKLLQEIPINQASLFLLQSALNITVPEFKKEFVVGSGYSLVKDETLPAEIFTAEHSTNKPSDILYNIPGMYKVALQNQLDNQILVFNNRDAFIKGRMQALGLGADAIPTDSYSSSLLGHPGFNLVSLSGSNEDSSESPQLAWDTLSATVDYHTFQIGLSNGANFSSGFSNSLKLLQPLNLTDSGNVQNWRQFFDRYGTHVVTHAFGGGSINVLAKVEEGSNEGLSNTDKFALLSETMANIMQQLANELIGKDAAYEPPPGIQYSFSQVGGDYKHYWSNFSELDETRNIDDWRESLKYDPAILTSRLQLIPISEVVNEIEGNRDLAYIIEEAASNLLNASLIYIPIERAYDSDDNPESRDRLDGSSGLPAGDFKSMQAFSEMFKSITESNKETQAQLLAAMAESQKRRAQEDERYQQEMIALKQQRQEDARAQMEQDRYDKELELRRQQLENERIVQENNLKFQMEQSRMQIEMQQQVLMEEIRQKNEDNMLNLINIQNQRRAEMALRSNSIWDKVMDFGSKVAGSLAQAAPFMALG